MLTAARPLDFILPTELEAREPPEARGLRRDQVRLLVSHVDDDRILHAHFQDLPDFLRPGGVLYLVDGHPLLSVIDATAKSVSPKYGHGYFAPGEALPCGWRASGGSAHPASAPTIVAAARMHATGLMAISCSKEIASNV